MITSAKARDVEASRSPQGKEKRNEPVMPRANARLWGLVKQRLELKETRELQKTTPHRMEKLGKGGAPKPLRDADYQMKKNAL